MRSYEAARGLFSFLGFCSWAVIVIGAILAFSGGTIAGTGFGRGANGMSALLGAAPGVILAMLGFYGLALVQMGRASVDSAEYGQQALEVSRQQLEVSRQALDQSRATAASYGELVKHRSIVEPTATQQAGKSAEGQSYGSRSDMLASRPDPKLTEATALTALSSATTGVLTPPEPEITVADMMPTEPEVVPMKIHFLNGVYVYGSQKFSSKEKALKYVAELGVNPNVKLPNA